MKRASFYRILKLNQTFDLYRLKLAWVLFSDLVGLRHLVVQLDPAMVCNLRCKMCYFGDPEYAKRKRRAKTTRFSYEELVTLSNIFFPKALALNIGAAGEPTMYKNIANVVQLAHKHKVPTVSLTTNGQALTPDQVKDLVKYGLDEIILSVHGVKKETYEHFMAPAKFDKLLDLLRLLMNEKIAANSVTPHIRINYTVNTENLYELESFFDVFGEYDFDSLQIRPVVEIKNAPYKWQNISNHLTQYHKILDTLTDKCAQKNVRLIATRNDPTLKNTKRKSNTKSFLLDAMLRTIKPGVIWKKDFDWENESYRDYLSRIKFRKFLLRGMFLNKRSFTRDFGDKENIYLTYEVLD